MIRGASRGFFCVYPQLKVVCHHSLLVFWALPIKGGDYEVEDLDKAAGLAVVCDHARSPYLFSAEPFFDRPNGFAEAKGSRAKRDSICNE